MLYPELIFAWEVCVYPELSFQAKRWTKAGENDPRALRIDYRGLRPKEGLNFKSLVPGIAISQ